MNVLKSHPGLIYVAVLVMLIVSIPMLRDERHVQRLPGWPTATDAQHRHSAM